MLNWKNLNNSKNYAPYFIFFLDCVSQLISMNPNEFEFTGHYLADIAFNCFTNRFYETVFPIRQDVNQYKRGQLDEDTSLLSMFTIEKSKKQALFIN
mmetsp:Transcript_21811/g.33740  ORF Transcript_21811/g.33740 Transcript_21811/m.33740 type:complete len:97 (+) Transcript_21811:1821-2111(+)